MNFLMVMLNRLEAAGIGTKGENLFLNQLPENADQAIVLLPPLTGNKIDWEMPGYRKSSFQMVVRSKDVLAGETLAKQAMDVLTIQGETDLEGVHIKHVLPRHDPVSYPLSEGNNIEHSVNFDAIYVIV